MDDEANILLVDAHTECYSRNNHLNLVTHPLVLDLLPLLVAELCVVIVTFHVVIAF